LYEQRALVPRLRAIYAEQLLTDDGELGHARDFASYGSQMDAALAQKLADLGPWIVPGKIVDKGCGTGKLLVELSRAYPRSAFVGVDLSREFLRMCDENHYAAEDVTLVQANIIERQVAPGTASSVIYSSVVHEIYSYSGYDRDAVHRALGNAAVELRSGGRVLVRDGVSPGLARWRMRLLDDETRAQFARFAKEFKHGQGAAHEVGAEGEIVLSAHLCNEFLCKKDYQKNWHIEAHEEYGTFTVEQWRAALDRAGFDALEVRAYVNGWIAEHRYVGKVELYDERGAHVPWPATNVVVVGARR
jgi:SAM-dependent methyltransferase